MSSPFHLRLINMMLLCVLSLALTPDLARAAKFSQRKSARTLKQTCDELRGLSLSSDEIDPVDGAMTEKVRDACLDTTQSTGSNPSDPPKRDVPSNRKSPPSFYGSPEAVRMKMLSVARAHGNLDELELKSLSAPEVSQPELARILSSSLPDARGLQGGYLQDEMIRRSLDAICKDFPNLEHTFPQVCGKMEAAGKVDPLLALRVSLFIDSVNFPGRLALRAGDKASAEFQARLRLLVLLVEASLKTDPLTSAVDILARSEAQLISAGLTPKIAARTAQTGGILLRLLGDLRAFPHATKAQAVALIMNAYGDVRDSTELKEMEVALSLKLTQLRAQLEAAELELKTAVNAWNNAKVKTRTLERKLTAQRQRAAVLRIQVQAEANAALDATLPSFTPAQVEAAGLLATYALEMSDLAFGKRGGDFSAPTIVRKMELLLGMTSATFTLLKGKPLWTAQIDAMIRFATASLRAAIVGDLENAHLAVQGAGKLALESDLDEDMPGIGLLFRLALAENMGDLRAIAISQFVDVGPWAGDVIFGANVGALSMPDAAGNFELAADATVGYAWDTFGLVGKARVSSLTFNSETTAGDTDKRLVDTDRYGGRLEGWAVTAPGTLRLEGRLSWEGELFDTINAGGVEPTDPEIRAGALPQVFDETRLFNRALAMAALRFEPSLTLGAYFGFGAGIQHENYDSVRAFSEGENFVILYDESVLSGTLEARIRFQWIAIPDFLALRFMSDSLWAGISQEAETIQASASSAVIQPERSSGWRIESLNRIFLDLEALALLGLTPSLSGGSDLFAVNTDQGSSMTLMPLFQFGLHATLF